MKKSLIIMISLLTAFSSMSVMAKSVESLDKMVAIVNDDVITKSELDRAIATAKIQLSQENVAAPSNDTLEKQALQQLINKKLQLQVAKQSGIQVSDADLENAIKKIADQNHISVDSLYQQINQEGMTTAEYRTEMRDQMTLQKLQQQEIAGKINVTPQEITAFANSRIWQSQSSNDAKEYRVENILVTLPDAPTPEDVTAAKERANVLLNKMHDGAKFQDVVNTLSNNQKSIEAGDLGWRKLGEIPNAFAAQVKNMQKNEIAGPIRTANGFHIIRLADVRGNTTAKTQTPDRKTIENMLLQKKFEEAMQSWVTKLRSQAFINVNKTA